MVTVELLPIIIYSVKNRALKVPKYHGVGVRHITYLVFHASLSGNTCSQ